MDLVVVPELARIASATGGHLVLAGDASGAELLYSSVCALVSGSSASVAVASSKAVRAP